MVNQDLIDAIKEGIARDRETRKHLEELAEIQVRYDSLVQKMKADSVADLVRMADRLKKN